MTREYAERPVAAVGVVVVRDDGRILLARRSNPPLQGLWSLPGGALEMGETITACARREVLEECGVDCTPTEIYHAFDSIHRDAEGRVQYHYLIVDVLARWTSGEVHAGTDASEAGWFTLDDMATLATTPAAIQVAQSLLLRMPPAVTNGH
ncbi:MAG: NUDIX hydrolase [Chloroflexota bacterium]|nr:NUDIX hydrolase [Chloroflexota bacterium]